MSAVSVSDSCGHWRESGKRKASVETPPSCTRLPRPLLRFRPPTASVRARWRLNQKLPPHAPRNPLGAFSLPGSGAAPWKAANNALSCRFSLCSSLGHAMSDPGAFPLFRLSWPLPPRSPRSRAPSYRIPGFGIRDSGIVVRWALCQEASRVVA
jgi:hypothetical protein